MEFDFTRDWSCTLRYSWDWATSLSGDQELYRLNRNFVPTETSTELDYGRDIITTKNRVRGRGRALSLTLTSGPGKAADIKGIAVMYTAEA